MNDPPPPSLRPEPHEELMGALKSLFEKGSYSDLLVTCGEDQYKVHKAILCTRSAFFARACDGSFREASEGKINLSDDDPQAVRLMMHYFYHLEYPHIDPPVEESEYKTVKGENQPQFDFVNGYRYEAAMNYYPAYTTLGFRKKQREKARLSMFPDSPPGPRDSNLSIHVKVYSLGEKYLIDGLKNLALQKFITEAGRFWATQDFLLAAKYAYTETVDPQHSLRDAILDVFHDKPQLLDICHVQNVVRDSDDLAFDLLMRHRRRGDRIQPW